MGHNTVRILNKGRYVLRGIASKHVEYGPMLQLPENGVIAITGGNGALGLVMGIWLLNKAKEQGGKKFSIKFLSRSCKITDQNMPMWKEIEAMANELGSDVEQAKCDVSSQAAADEFIQGLTPNLTGFIHSAGVLQESIILNQTAEKFDKVFESKSRAATYVHDALERFENPDLAFFWMFSSGAVYGNMGQINYSGSNSFLDGLSRHRRAMGKVSMAPQWGAWGDVGMARNLDEATRRRMAMSPFPYFSNAEGLYGMEQLIRSNYAYGQVMKANPQVVFGMIMDDSSATACYTRNFYSPIAPPLPGDTYKNLYATITYTKRNKAQKIHSGLVFRNFWPDVAEALEELEESKGMGFAFE